MSSVRRRETREKLGRPGTVVGGRYGLLSVVGDSEEELPVSRSSTPVPSGGLIEISLKDKLGVPLDAEWYGKLMLSYFRGRVDHTPFEIEVLQGFGLRYPYVEPVDEEEKTTNKCATGPLRGPGDHDEDPDAYPNNDLKSDEPVGNADADSDVESDLDWDVCPDRMCLRCRAGETDFPNNCWDCAQNYAGVLHRSRVLRNERAVVAPSVPQKLVNVCKNPAQTSLEPLAGSLNVALERALEEVDDEVPNDVAIEASFTGTSSSSLSEARGPLGNQPAGVRARPLTFWRSFVGFYKAHSENIKREVIQEMTKSSSWLITYAVMCWGVLGFSTAFGVVFTVIAMFVPVAQISPFWRLVRILSMITSVQYWEWLQLGWVGVRLFRKWNTAKDWVARPYYRYKKSLKKWIEKKSRDKIKIFIWEITELQAYLIAGGLTCVVAVVVIAIYRVRRKKVDEAVPEV